MQRAARRFFTYNYLNAWLPKYEDDLPRRLLRSAVIGFAASFVSDTRCDAASVHARDAVLEA